MEYNALAQVEVTTSRHTLRGFSIAGLATYLQVPDLDVCFDMGECPLSALAIRHVLLTHAHGDHSRCLLRHAALRAMVGRKDPVAYYVPEVIVDALRDVMRAEARFEEVPEQELNNIQLIPLAGDRAPVPLAFRRGLDVEAFLVDHRVPSLGYTIVERRRKLLPAWVGKAGEEIAQARRAGLVVHEETRAPLVTFIGDCTGRTLDDEAHIWNSQVLVLEATFLEAGEEDVARAKSHTHISEIARVLRERRDAIACETIVLKHFSMKYPPQKIAQIVYAAIPPEMRDRIKLLLPT